MPINQLTLAVLIGLATQYRKGTGSYEQKGFKPFWKNDKGQSFYGFLETFGYTGDQLKPFLTTGMYVTCHLERTTAPAAKVAAVKPAAKVATVPATAKAIAAAPRLVKGNAPTKLTLKLTDLNLEDIAAGIKNGSIRFAN